MEANKQNTPPHIQEASNAQLPGSLLESTGYMLSTAGRILRERFEAALVPTGLRARHFGVLAGLQMWGPLPQGSVAQRLSMDKSTMVAVIDDLEGWGFVERRRSREDRRAYELTLTETGVQKLAEANAAAAGFDTEWLAPLEGIEQAQLHDLLKSLLYKPGGLLADPHKQLLVQHKD